MKFALNRVLQLPALWSPAAIAFSTLASAAAQSDGHIVRDDFESDLSRWRLDNPGQIEIIEEPGTSNHVLQLTPRSREFTHAILDHPTDLENYRFSGRFLFPVAGDGYLGFIYNYRQGMVGDTERMDFGCIYVKSNGSYIRISPHYDGNPSWRLHEELKVDLTGDRKIQTGRWYDFRMDVVGAQASLFIDDMDAALVVFDLIERTHGALGLEARPGGGAPVWIDDLVVSELADQYIPETPPISASSWQYLGPFEPDEALLLDAPELPQDGWQNLPRDRRGMLLTGAHTQFRSGDKSWLYLRRHIVGSGVESGSGDPTWLSVSSANRADVWLNGYFRGTVAEERLIWSDFRTHPDRPGARLPLILSEGDNELLIRVHGRRFAGGGMFVELERPGD